MAELTHERLTEQEISEGLKICPHGCGCIRRRALLQIQATNIIGACGHSWDGSLHRVCPRCAIKSCEVWMKSFSDRWESVRRESAPSGEDFGNSTVLRIAQEALSELANGMPSELLERRKAETCPTCKGIGAPWNNSSSVPCDACHGTWKHGNAELIAALRDCLDVIEPIRDEMWKQGTGDGKAVKSDAAKCCDEVISFARAALSRAEGKRV